MNKNALMSPYIAQMTPSVGQQYLDDMDRASDTDIAVALALQTASFADTEPDKVGGFIAPLYIRQALYLRDNRDAAALLAAALLK